MAVGESSEVWEALIGGPTWEWIERESLPEFLKRQRWFAAKARELRAVRMADSARPVGFPSSSLLALVEVEFAEGEPDTYFLPLAAASGREAERVGREVPQRIIATWERSDGPALLYDGLADHGTCWALLTAIESNRSAPTRQGEIRALRTTAFDRARGPVGTPLEVIPQTTEQSNSVVLFDHRLLMKAFRRIEPGINPDFEIGKFLCEETPFDRIPQTAGTIEYHREGREPATLAVLQALVRNQGTGWDHAFRELKAFFERADREGTVDDLADADDALMGSYPAAAELLGRRTAELHRALASDAFDPDFAPEPLIAADLSFLRQRIRDQFEQALEGLEDSLGRNQFPATVQTQARQVLAQAPRLLAELDALPAARPGSVRIRCHGDYHLGQILRVDDDFVILDFEGEPTRPLDARRRKDTPIKDVVGMLRSFDYATYAALFERTSDNRANFERLAPWARLWVARASAAFLDAYRAEAGGEEFVPADSDAFGLLLRSFTLDKVLYELWYELNNRPDWVRIPIQGILALARPPGPHP
jgi:maltose alpha-D-glucosyltransferase/alpha-amylase